MGWRGPQLSHPPLATRAIPLKLAPPYSDHHVLIMGPWHHPGITSPKRSDKAIHEATVRMPMIRIRRSEDRGHANHGWLDTYHTFSFAGYHDPAHMGFRTLRVLNQDRIDAGTGFGAHPHRDMEIISYVLEGSLRHRDSLGNEAIIRPGEVQRMTAGTGVVHSEMNASTTEPAHFLQIWITPRQAGLPPSHDQRAFDLDVKGGSLRLVASPDGKEDSVTIHQDARVYAGRIAAGTTGHVDLDRARHGWVHVARGSIRMGEDALGPGDGAAVTDETRLDFDAIEDAEVLVFDLP